MVDVQDELLSHSMNVLQIRRLAGHMRIFLAWVFFASFFDLIIYFLYFDKSSTYLNYWFIFLVTVIAGIWFSISYITQEKIKNNDKIDAIFQLFCSDLLARAVCHELDHLDGILFIDRVEK